MDLLLFARHCAKFLISGVSLKLKTTLRQERSPLLREGDLDFEKLNL